MMDKISSSNNLPANASPRRKTPESASEPKSGAQNSVDSKADSAASGDSSSAFSVSLKKAEKQEPKEGASAQKAGADSVAADAGAQAAAVQSQQAQQNQQALQSKNEAASNATPNSSRSDSFQPGKEANALSQRMEKGMQLVSSAEKSPFTQKAAVSLNTGAAIAGPKVWSKDWIFEGQDANPGLNPLIDDGSLPAMAGGGANVKRALFESADQPQISDAEKAKILTALAQIQGGIAGTAQAQKSLQAQRASMAQMAQLQAGAAQSQGSGSATAAQAASLPVGAAGQLNALQAAYGNDLEILDVNAEPEAAEGEVPSPALKGQPQAALSASGKRSFAQSGSDFVDTLSQVRGSAANARMGAQAGAAPAGGQQAFNSAAAMSPFGFASLKGRDAMGGEEPYAAGTRTNLRVVDGGATDALSLKGKRSPFAAESGLAGASIGAQLGAAQAQADVQSALAGGGRQGPPMVEVNALVTKGSMAKDRLSSEALLGVGTGVRALSAQGGGEMRIRLKPDSLGELNLKVSTSGNQVRLQVQASDERARKVLEESVNHLKDSLSAQNLSLAKLEVVVAQSQGQGAADGNGNQNGQGNQSQGGYQDLLNPNQQHNQSSNYGNGGGRSDAYDTMIDLDPIVSIRRGNSAALASSIESASRSRPAAVGRLDVRA